MITIPSNAQVPLLVGLGAIFGALSRYYLMQWTTNRWGVGFPYGTLMVNLSGSALMGCWATLMAQWGLPSSTNLLLAVGFLGSYTTFSTYALDTSNLIQTSRPKFALFYWVSSLLLGLLSLEAGIYLTRYLINLR